MSSNPGLTGEPLPKTGDPFLDSVAADAIKSQRETGVPASVTLAQALIESNRGKSGLSRNAHNYFGIKGTGPAGSVIMPTREVVNGRNIMINAPFRKYNSAAESFADHGRFFIQNKRYRIAMQNTGDARRFAQEIQRAGYATDPNYAAVLIQIIDRYNLTRFDQIARSAAPTPQPVTQPPTTDTPPSTPTTNVPTQQQEPTPGAQPSTPTTGGQTVNAGTASTQPGTAQPSDGVWRRGMRGPEVGRIQDELILLGYLTLSQKLTGPAVFGPKTENALMVFQRDNHLTASGTYDAPTREAIRQVSAGIRRNQVKNPVVQGMQDRLVELGYMTSDQVAQGPGFFGPKTETALKEFQTECGLEPDGILTLTTYQVLYVTEG